MNRGGGGASHVWSLLCRLSTTFVYRVHGAGPEEGAGLQEGDMVHMINGVSVIRSSLEEIMELLKQW